MNLAFVVDFIHLLVILLDVRMFPIYTIVVNICALNPSWIETFNLTQYSGKFGPSIRLFRKGDDRGLPPY